MDYYTLLDYLISLCPPNHKELELTASAWKGIYEQTIRVASEFEILPVTESLPLTATLPQAENYIVYKSLLQRPKNERYKKRVLLARDLGLATRASYEDMKNDNKDHDCY